MGLKKVIPKLSNWYHILFHDIKKRKTEREAEIKKEVRKKKGRSEERREREKKGKSRRPAYPGRVLVTPRLGGGLF